MKVHIDSSHYLNPTMQPSAGSSLLNWLRVLAENRFRIDWQFIPRALYVTLMIALFTPFRFYEKLKFDEKVRKLHVAPPLFIVGHFRSGTTFLHYLMGHDHNLGYVSTFETMTPWVFLGSEKIFKGVVRKYLPEKRPMDDLEADVSFPYEEEYALANLSPYSFYNGWYFPKNMERYFRKYVLFDSAPSEAIEEWKKTYRYLLQKETCKHNGKRILLKSPVNTGRIKLLLELFPDAQFIHICRNPYEVYLSTWRLYEKILPIFAFQHIERDVMDHIILSFYKGVYERYLEERHLIPRENLAEIRYEEFYRDPVVNLEPIYEQLGITHFHRAKPAFQKFADGYKNYRPNHYDIGDDIREKIYREWKFAFDAFGYEP